MVPRGLQSAKQGEAMSRRSKILMYHSVHRTANDPNQVCTSPELFEAQMLYLKQRGLRAVSMRELRKATSTGDSKGLVGLTFDDGYEDFLHSAVPVMERLGFSATVFVVANMLGEQSSWKSVYEQTSRLKVLDAEELREISARGMEVGSHGMTHTMLRGLDPELLEREVNDSRRVLSEVLGEEVEGFSYPYGILDKAVVQAVRQAGYAYACSVKEQWERSAYVLPRIPVSEKDHLLRFKAKLRVYGLYSKIKRTYLSNSSLKSFEQVVVPSNRERLGRSPGSAFVKDEGVTSMLDSRRFVFVADGSRHLPGPSLHSSIKRPIRKQSGGRKASAYIWAIALSGQILSLIDCRLFWRVCNTLGKTMPEGRYTCELIIDSNCIMNIQLDDPYWSPCVSTSWVYEPEFLRVLEKLKHVPYAFIDCGANIGYWSIMVTGESLGAHKTLAVEASSRNFKLLEENCKLNGKRFWCANVALYSVSGQKVTITTDSSGHHPGDRIARLTTEGMRRIGEVSTATLGDVVREHFGEIPDCLVVKLDVEGAETDVFRGANDLLERDVLFYYEDKTGSVSRYVLEELELTALIPSHEGQLRQVRDPEEVTRHLHSLPRGGRHNLNFNVFACKEQSRFLKEIL